MCSTINSTLCSTLHSILRSTLCFDYYSYSCSKFCSILRSYYSSLRFSPRYKLCLNLRYNLYFISWTPCNDKSSLSFSKTYEVEVEYIGLHSFMLRPLLYRNNSSFTIEGWSTELNWVRIEHACLSRLSKMWSGTYYILLGLS